MVSLLPSATEIVFALGRGADLVGVTFECDFPAEARHRRIVSTSTLPEGLGPAEIDAVVSELLASGKDLYRLDEGALAELDAEVVLTQDLCAVCAVDISRVEDALAHLGCSAQVLTLDPATLDDVVESIATVGSVLGAKSGRMRSWRRCGAVWWSSKQRWPGRRSRSPAGEAVGGRSVPRRHRGVGGRRRRLLRAAGAPSGRRGRARRADTPLRPLWGAPRRSGTAGASRLRS